MSLELSLRRRELLKRSILLGISAVGLSSQSNPLRASTGLLLPSYYADDAQAAAFWAQPRVLDLYRPATGEHRVVCYWRDGSYDIEGYRQACYMLRDVRAGLVVAIDVRLLNLLRGQQGWLGAAYGYRDPYHINSGYRCHHTNATTEGAVKNSLHEKAMASDGRFPGLPVDYQGKLVAAFRAGGVGFYVGKNFIHNDVGRVRFWAK